MDEFHLWLERKRGNYKDQVTAGDDYALSVGELLKHAGKPVTILVKPLKKDLDSWSGDYKHMKTVNTKYPILVIRMPSGELTIADGLNRLKKRISVEKKDTIAARIIDWHDIPKSALLTTGIITANADLATDLAKYTYKKTKGQYKVFGIKLTDLKALGKKYGQESVVFNDKEVKI